jgi:hypothetical protein
MEDLIIIVLELLLCLARGVFGVIVLLKDDILCIFAIIILTLLKLILQNAAIEVLVHLAIYLGCIANPLPQHAAPNHQRATAKLHSHQETGKPLRQ